MRDLVAINGPWQIITFLNFYMTEYDNQTYPACTIILFEVNDELNVVCKSILSNYNFVEKIIDFNQIQNIVSQKFDNLWIGKLFSFQSKNIVERFSSLPIILFEEGIHSYIDQKHFKLKNIIWASGSIEEKLKVFYKYVFKKKLLVSQFPQFIMPNHQKRCKKKYYLLPLMESKSSKSTVSNKFIFSVLENVTLKLEQSNITVSDKPCVLVAGQYFSSLDLLSFDYELSVYNKIIDYYLNNGYDVYWKGHPRSKIFDLKIRESFKERVNILENNTIPLEIVLMLNPDVEVCGISSSVLLYKAVLFNSKAKQSLNLVKNNLNKDCIWYKDFLKMFSLIDENVQRINIEL